MKLGVLKLVNFRNYDHLIIKPSFYINILYGKNGTGKTNIVEAIYTLALTKSFRTINDNFLIKNEKEFFNISGSILDEYNHDDLYKIIEDKKGKSVFINNNRIKLLSDYISKINVIVFSPNEMKLVKESPSIRRKYLNIEISQYDKNYLFYLNEYNKILKQRNSYLKQLSINYNQSFEYLDILTDQLIDKGLLIFKYRIDFINKISCLINEYFKKINANDKLNIKIVYKSHFTNKNKEEIKKIFKNNQNRELNFGKTLIGVHLDDFEILLDNYNIRDYGSEGQQKNAIISLKLAEIELLNKKNNDYPILILDDIFSELDNEKINNIFSVLPNNIQVFITTTEIEKIDKKIIDNAKIFNLNNLKNGEDINE